MKLALYITILEIFLLKNNTKHEIGAAIRRSSSDTTWDTCIPHCNAWVQILARLLVPASC